MKVTSLLYAVLLAGVAANAAAVAEPEPDAELVRRWCWRPGQSCGKLKRAADAAATALADGEFEYTEDNHLAKRAADALASAVADAYAAAGPEPEAEAEPWCWRPGQSCGKVKRAASAISEALAIPEPESEADALARRWCWRPGQSCGKAKRAADALAAAAAEAVAAT